MEEKKGRKWWYRTGSSRLKKARNRAQVNRLKRTEIINSEVEAIHCILGHQNQKTDQAVEAIVSLPPRYWTCKNDFLVELFCRFLVQNLLKFPHNYVINFKVNSTQFSTINRRRVLRIDHRQIITSTSNSTFLLGNSLSVASMMSSISF